MFVLAVLYTERYPSPIPRLMLFNHSIAIVMLAAGRGKRMGDTGAVPSKLMLPLRDGQPVLAHALRSAAALEPENGAISEQLGYLALAMGMMKEADAQFKRAQTLGRTLPPEVLQQES